MDELGFNVFKDSTRAFFGAHPPTTNPATLPIHCGPYTLFICLISFFRSYLIRGLFSDIAMNLLLPTVRAAFGPACGNTSVWIDATVAQARALVARGADGVILGCTEIELLVKQEDIPEIPLFCSAELHIEAAARMFSLRACRNLCCSCLCAAAVRVRLIASSALSHARELTCPRDVVL